MVEEYIELDKVKSHQKKEKAKKAISKVTGIVKSTGQGAAKLMKATGEGTRKVAAGIGAGIVRARERYSVPSANVAKREAPSSGIAKVFGQGKTVGSKIGQRLKAMPGMNNAQNVFGSRAEGLGNGGFPNVFGDTSRVKKRGKKKQQSQGYGSGVDIGRIF